MFASVQPERNHRQILTSLASLFFQFALLAVLGTHVALHSTGVAHTASRGMTVTPIYFARPADPPTPAAASLVLASAPVPKPPADPELSPTAQPENQADANDNADSSGPSSDGEQMPAMGSFDHFHHHIQGAQPVFTPDPPILYGEIPDPARGKDLVLELIINEHGAVVAAQVIQPVGYGLEEKIVKSLGEWRFIPANVNGVAVISRELFRFHFPG